MKELKGLLREFIEGAVAEEGTVCQLVCRYCEGFVATHDKHGRKLRQEPMQHDSECPVKRARELLEGRNQDMGSMGYTYNEADKK